MRSVIIIKAAVRQWIAPAMFALLLTVCHAGSVRAADYVWLEGESPTHANIDAKPDKFGGGMISDDQWLNLNFDENSVEKAVPAGGILLDYDFNAPSAGRYELWNRFGFEVDRTAFDWQVDAGDWTTVPHDAATYDLIELGFWAHVSWVKMGASDLTAGKHTLHIRINVPHGGDNKPQRLHYVSDAIAIVKGAFHPNSKYKPDDLSWQTAADKTAAAHVFQLPGHTGSAQTSTSLAGIWQIARFDEGNVEDRTGPIKNAPTADVLAWKSMAVPGDRNQAHPEMTFAHRYFLRARVNVPAAMAGQSLYLHLPAVNMIASVFVNGQQYGWTKAPFAVFDCDITRAIKPGGINEIWVGIKDTYYGFKPDGNNNPRTRFTIPTQWSNSQQFITSLYDFPVWNHPDNGILQEPTLVAAGKAYTSDVFALPSVKNKSLGLEITVKNPTDQPMALSVQNAVEPLAGGAPEKTFKPSDVTVAANSEQVVKLSETWTNPKLWWPDDPQQYVVVTRIVSGGGPVDERRTKFGFREWDWHSSHFTLNGIPWYGRADTASFANNAVDDLKGLKMHGENMIRLWGEGGWHELSSPEAALDFFDSHGMNIRRTGIFDGEGVNYTLTPELFENWRTQLAAWAKGQRNHPSIFIWSIENEITFINAGRGQGPTKESDPDVRKAGEMVAQLDPTRPLMVDGGNALGDESLPVYGIHYIEGAISQYPDWGYNLTNKVIEHAQRGWPITQQKPLFFGETFFSPGYNLTTLAAAGGESTMIGKGEAVPGIGLIGKMMSEGYRWSGVAAFHFWKGRDSDLYYNSWQPIAVLSRQWDSTFGSGQKVKRTFGIFNDTHFEQPISFTWTLNISGKKAGAKTAIYTVDPGLNKKFDDVIPIPGVTTRQDGELVLTLTVKGKEVFRDVKPISVLPPPVIAGVAPGTTAALPQDGTHLAQFRPGSEARMAVRLAADTPGATASGSANTASLTAKNLLVLDPFGSVAAFLKSRGVGFTLITDLKNLPAAGKILIVGKDALDSGQSTSSALAAYASTGRTVIVLEQANPLRYQAMPAEMATTTDEGRIGFPEDLEHPVFHHLAQHDFQTWGPGEVLYHGAYEKPTSGGKSLLEAGDGLRDTALVEVPAGSGLLLVSQLLVGEKLNENAVAQQLLANMINYGESYKLIFRSVTAAAGDNGPLTTAVDAIGLKYAKSDDILGAMTKPNSIVIVNASPANLKLLAQNLPKVNAFTQGGGWIVFNHLTPEGLDDYNKIVGFEHMIRKFGREKVTFPATRSPLASGLSTSDIVMNSGQRIFGFQAGDYPAEDAFSYVLDYDEVAPFAKSDFGNYGNIVNNFVGADGWPLIINFPAPKDGTPYNIHITLPKPQTLTRFTWVGNTFYMPQTKVNLLFDGKDIAEFNTNPNNEPQTFAIAPPRTAQNITLQIADWVKQPDKVNIGIDNIYLYAQRPADFYRNVKPLLNIGALLAYPRGPGGFMLNNVNYKDTETVPENLTKKRNIMAVLLRNLKAPFSGGRSIIAGSTNLAYTPVDISKQANAYRNEQGWFGDKNFTFKGLPAGKQKLGGVPYNVYDFATSPLPTVLMLGGNGVPGNLADHINGIPVGRKSDALFFLQAARLDARRNSDEVKNNRKYEMARYVVHYADGKTENIPVYAEINVDDFKQTAPVATLPGAQIAWTAPYAGSDQNAVAYSMQWNNPHPDVVIDSLDFQYGADRRGIPAVLAITAAAANS